MAKYYLKLSDYVDRCIVERPFDIELSRAKDPDNFWIIIPFQHWQLVYEWLIEYKIIINPEGIPYGRPLLRDIVMDDYQAIMFRLRWM